MGALIVIGIALFVWTVARSTRYTEKDDWGYEEWVRYWKNGGK